MQKRQVGERLALCAKAKIYGYDQEYSGPVVQSVAFLNGEVRVHYSYGKGLNLNNEDELIGFKIVAKDKIYKCAKGRI